MFEDILYIVLSDMKKQSPGNNTYWQEWFSIISGRGFNEVD